MLFVSILIGFFFTGCIGRRPPRYSDDDIPERYRLRQQWSSELGYETTRYEICLAADATLPSAHRYHVCYVYEVSVFN